MRTPGSTSSSVISRGGALRAHGQRAAVQHRIAQLGQRRGLGQRELLARPGSANHAASPVNHSDTSAPAANAMAATVKRLIAPFRIVHAGGALTTRDLVIRAILHGMEATYLAVLVGTCYRHRRRVRSTSSTGGRRP